MKNITLLSVTPKALWGLMLGLALMAPSIGSATNTGDTLYAIDGNNNLIRFNSDNPGQVVIVGPTLPFVAIDFRPADGKLYGITDSTPPTIYVISTEDGGATAVGSPINMPLDGDSFGFDFNPLPDRIRLTTDNDANLRLNPNNGALTATDGRLNYTVGGKVHIVASAYTNSFGPSPRQMPGTTLYNIDSLRDVLVIQNPPNDGVLSIVGPLGIDVNAQTSFDIAGADNAAYLSAVLPGETTSTLFSVNLTTGQATAIGRIGASSPIQAMAATLRP